MTTMSDYEDDFDDDLPPISVSQSAGEKKELEMPPASEVASQRAREAAAERALQELRDSYARSEPPAGRLAAAGREENETALSQAVTAMHVSDTRERGDTAELSALAAHLPAEDAAFIETYVQALKENPHAAKTITEQVVSGVCSALAGGAWAGARGGAGALGAAAALLAAPPAPRAARALHALLDAVAAPEQVRALSAAACAALRAPARLLAAHDAARSGAGRGADALAAALLAAAVDRVLAVEGADADADADVAARLRARWRRLPASRQLLLLRAAGRALAAGAAAAPLLAALATPLPRAPPLALQRQQVLANVSKLQLLFAMRAPEHEYEHEHEHEHEPEPEHEHEHVWPPALLHQDMCVDDDPQAMDRLQKDIEELKQEVIKEIKEEELFSEEEGEKMAERSPERKRLRRSPRFLP